MKRRGACPTFSVPMQTGDGLLARLHLAGPMSVLALGGLCRAAECQGNGVIEVTQRGSLQIRGLRPDTLAGFRADVEALDFDAPEGVVVQTPPLSAESLGLAADLREVLGRSGIATRIAPKTTVVLDAGGGLPIDGLAADIRLLAQGGRMHVGVGDAPVVWLGKVAAENAGAAVLGMLEVMAAAGPGTRVRDLDPAVLGMAIGRWLDTCPAPGSRGMADALGRHADAVGIGLPFGWAEAATLRRLLAAAAEAGAERVWAAPGRALVFEAVPEASMDDLVAAAALLGFIVDPADARRRVHACTGAPRCASALQPIRLLAGDVASGAAPLLEEGECIHLSGCTKGCAHPGKAAVTLVGWESGFHLVLDGRPEDLSATSLAPMEILTRLPDLLEKRRRAPEAAAARGVGAGRG